jgi:polar amino acid transport system substrate-binding protein
MKIVLPFFLFLTSFYVEAEQIKFLAHPLNPLVFEKESKVVGIASDLVMTLIMNNNQLEDISLVPFSRGMAIVNSQPNHALFAVARTKKREKNYKWVGPLITSGVYLYKLKSNSVKVSNLTAIKDQYSISVGRGNVDHIYLDKLGFSKLYPVNRQIQSLQMLVLGRVDLTPMSELVMPELAKIANIDINIIESTRVKLYDSKLYIAFSKDTDDKIILKWQKTLDELKASNVYQRIIDKYQD